MKKIVNIVFAVLLSLSLYAQDSIQVADSASLPKIEYTLQRQSYTIADIKVSGADSYEDFVLIGFSGLAVGDEIEVPGEQITKAVKRFWKQGLFSDVKIKANKIVGDSVWLEIALQQRPRASEVVYQGVKKSEKEDIEVKVGLRTGSQLTPNILDNTKTVIKKYYAEKGFHNTDVDIRQYQDPDHPGYVRVAVLVDKKAKTRVGKIYLTGNEALTDLQINKAMKKTNDNNIINLFRTKKFVTEEYENDKKAIIDKYNEIGYRDAYIVADSVVPNPEDPTRVDVYITVSEGGKYYVRNISWVGNTVYPSEALNNMLGVKKGDTYNLKLLNDRLINDDDAVSKLYTDNGYLFFNVEPVETSVSGDSIDFEMRMYEGRPATINEIKIVGNERVYEHVVRRELYTRPGDIFSYDALERSFRAIGNMGHFEQTAINPQIEPDQVNGTVDIDWQLESKGNDQVELSFGWGQIGPIGRVSLKFTNFSMYNLFHKSDNYRMFLPQGDGQTLSLSGQTNGRYYQSYSISFLEPWLGGKRPNTLSVSLFYSKQTDISSNYYNSAYYQNMYNYMYGYGNYYGNYGGGYYNNYESYYDPDKYITMFGASVGWGRRLHWPDDYFTFYSELSYTRYNLKQWSYFLINNGTCNNINLGLTVSRNTTDHPIFPRTGSDFAASVYFTPPYSLWDGKDYKNLASDNTSASYQDELRDKHKWIEYHKWKFRSRTYTSLTNGINKRLVLVTRFDFGLLGHYNKYKKSPFETFYMGGDGMSGGSYTYATEIVGLRGYENGSITPYSDGYAYTRMSAELRYPFMMEASAIIYGLAFVEGGNAWNSIGKFNPFDLKRSAGLGVRIMIPIVGLMGIDWAYGFDPVMGSHRYGGSQVHFILGQEF